MDKLTNSELRTLCSLLAKEHRDTDNENITTDGALDDAFANGFYTGLGKVTDKEALEALHSKVASELVQRWERELA